MTEIIKKILGGNKMNELLKIETREEKQVVSAKELYDFLELESKNWSRWHKHNIEENSFFTENQDFQAFVIKKNGNETKDFWITIEMAKHLAMSQKTKKSFELREYFIKIEQAWNTPEMIMKRALEIAKFKAEEATQKLLANTHKIEFYNDVIESDTATDIATVSKVLNFKGVGRNNLYEILRQKGILQNNNIPYQRYVDQGYFRVIESKWNSPLGEVRVNFKTVVYQKGVEFIAKTLKNLGYVKGY